MPRAYLRAALFAAAAIVLVSAATFAVHAEPQERNCITRGGIEARLSALPLIENAIEGDAAQKVSDALSDHFQVDHVAVVSVAAFLGNGPALVYGFDADRCAIIAGHMTLDVYNAARVVAGLEPAGVRAGPTKAI